MPEAYVYVVLVDGTVRYIGKGRGARLFSMRSMLNAPLLDVVGRLRIYTRDCIASWWKRSGQDRL
jgi:hypothetical protein